MAKSKKSRPSNPPSPNPSPSAIATDSTQASMKNVSTSNTQKLRPLIVNTGSPVIHPLSTVPPPVPSSYTSSLPPPAPQGLPPTYHPAPPQTTSSQFLSGNTIAALVNSLSPELRVFLEPNHKSKLKTIPKMLIYRVLIHFNLTSACYAQLKGYLYAQFKADLLPHLRPFQLPPVPRAMDMDTPSLTKDFNPLSRKTTRKMLREAILKHSPSAEISPNARLDGLQLLYQAHVDKDLVIPGQTKSVRKPRILDPAQVKEEDLEALRLALQAHAPNIFVHSIAMSHKVLVDIYREFILEEPPYQRLVCGYHYSIIG